jgi:hypothetical protein
VPDLTRRQTRILFELSNGKQLIVSQEAAKAFVCSADELEDPRRGIAAPLDDVRRLSDTECLSIRERFALAGLGDIAVYGLSPGGIETMLETSMHPYDE